MNVTKGSRPPFYPLPRAWRAHAVHTPGSVLLETAGGLGSDHVSYLFTAPKRILRASSLSELQTLLHELETANRAGFFAAGYLSYEAGYALQNIPTTAPPSTLACFGLYCEPLRFDHHTGTATASPPQAIATATALSAAPALSSPQLQIDPAAYTEKFADIQRLLTAGDTYQVNLTTQVNAELFGSPLALYDTLIEAQPVDFAAILHFDDNLTLSFSPELFFRTADATITTRPMKGTAPRGRTPEEDTAQRDWLAHDEKNHAEHVMIVDLLRNDLGRLCEHGSVVTSNLFRIEPYPTLFQMTSTVNGTLRPHTQFSDILRALFPSGSVTGAPKRRTMEIIRELEDAPRGVYTGAIGFVAPSGNGSFSVPIRTLNIHGNQASMGVGGGVVADSTAAAEYEECLLKASFLHKASTPPQLIETLLWSNGYPFLDLHLGRLAKSAADLGFPYDLAEIRSALTTAAIHFNAETRVRLLLASDGSPKIESSPLTGPTGDLRVRIASRRILSTDVWLQHKTTRRALYDREFARARIDGFDEVLFLNELDELAEGSISNLFLEINGNLYTPPLNAGVLPGILRQHLLNTNSNLSEKSLRLEHLASAQAIYLGNALRGLRTVGSLHFE